MGIKYFKECCDELGIDVDNTFCCGSSRDTDSISNNPRYVFKPTENQLKPQHQYAVKYFTKEKMYLCWSRKRKVKITKFSCKKQDAQDAVKENQTYFDKYALSRHGNKEKVYVFKRESVLDFLAKLQIKQLEHKRQLK